MIMSVRFDDEIKGRVFRVKRGESADGSITLFATNEIITKNNTTVITAILRDENGVAMRNERLHLTLKNGSTIIYSDDILTDRYGKISYTYTGTGIGKIDVIVKYDARRILQETYGLWDTFDYLKSTDTYTKNTDTTYTHIDDNGIIFNLKGNNPYIYIIPYNIPVSSEKTCIEFDIDKSTYTQTFGMYLPYQNQMNNMGTTLLNGDIKNNHVCIYIYPTENKVEFIDSTNNSVIRTVTNTREFTEDNYGLLFRSWVTGDDRTWTIYNLKAYAVYD